MAAEVVGPMRTECSTVWYIHTVANARAQHSAAPLYPHFALIPSSPLSFSLTLTRVQRPLQGRELVSGTGINMKI